MTFHLLEITQQLDCKPEAQQAAQALETAFWRGLPYPISHPLWRMGFENDGRAKDCRQLEALWVNWAVQSFENWLRLTSMSLVMDYLLSRETVTFSDAEQLQINQRLNELRFPSLGTWKNWLDMVEKKLIPHAAFSPFLSTFATDYPLVKDKYASKLVNLRNSLNLAHGVAGLSPEHLPEIVRNLLNFLLPLLTQARWFEQHPLYLLQQPLEHLQSVAAWRLDQPTLTALTAQDLDLSLDYPLHPAETTWAYGHFEFILLDEQRGVCQPLSPLVVEKSGLPDTQLALMAQERILLYAQDTGKRILYTGMGYCAEKLYSETNITALADLFRLRQITLEHIAARACDAEALQERCQQRARVFLQEEQQRSSYTDSLFTERAALTTHLQAFLEGTAPALLLVGTSGIGKSWQLAHWISLFLDGKSDALWLPLRTLHMPNLATETQPANVLMKWIMRQVRLEGEWKDWREQLKKMERRPLVLLVDAVNEAGDAAAGKALFDGLQAVLAEWETHSLPAVKLIYSVRYEFLHSYCTRSGGKTVLPEVRWHYYPPDHPPRNAEGQLEPWLTLQGWDASELQQAYRRYQAQWHTHTSEAELITHEPWLRLLAHPYWLRLACQCYAEQALPKDLVWVQLHERLLEQVVFDLQPPDPARWHWMKDFIGLMLQEKTALLPLDKVYAVSALQAGLSPEPDSLVSKLVQAHILRWIPAEDPQSGLTQSLLGFAQEGLAETLLSEYWLRSAAAEAFFALPFWQNRATEVESFPLLAGAGATLLIRLGRQQPQRVAEWLLTLAATFAEQFHEQFLYPVIADNLQVQPAEVSLTQALLAASPPVTATAGLFFHQLGHKYHYTQWQWLVLPAYQQALQIRQSLQQQQPDNLEFAQALGTSCNNLALFLADQGEPAEAERLYRQALSISQDLAERHPQRVDFVQALGTNCNNLAVFLKSQGQPAEAERLYRQALRISQDLADRHPQRVDFAQDLGTSCNNLALFLEDQGEPAEAERLYRQALCIRQDLADRHPQRVDFSQVLGASCNNLAVFLKSQGQAEEAERLYRQALSIRQDLAERHPQRVDFAQDLGTSCNNLALFLEDQGEPAEAERLYRQALSIRQDLADRHPQRVDFAQALGISCNNLAAFLASQDKPAEAERLYRQALGIRQDLAERHPQRVDLLLSLCISQANFLGFLEPHSAEYWALRPRFKQQLARLAPVLPHHPQVKQLIDWERRLPSAD